MWIDIAGNVAMGIDIGGVGDIRGHVHSNVTIWINCGGIRIDGNANMCIGIKWHWYYGMTVAGITGNVKGRISEDGISIIGNVTMWIGSDGDIMIGISINGIATRCIVLLLTVLLQGQLVMMVMLWLDTMVLILSVLLYIDVVVTVLVLSWRRT